jgi:hypothetical protein
MSLKDDLHAHKDLVIHAHPDPTVHRDPAPTCPICHGVLPTDWVGVHGAGLCRPAPAAPPPNAICGMCFNTYENHADIRNHPFMPAVPKTQAERCGNDDGCEVPCQREIGHAGNHRSTRPAEQVE